MLRISGHLVYYRGRDLLLRPSTKGKEEAMWAEELLLHENSECARWGGDRQWFAWWGDLTV